MLRPSRTQTRGPGGVGCGPGAEAPAGLISVISSTPRTSSPRARPLDAAVRHGLALAGGQVRPMAVADPCTAILAAVSRSSARAGSSAPAARPMPADPSNLRLVDEPARCPRRRRVRRSRAPVVSGPATPVYGTDPGANRRPAPRSRPRPRSTPSQVSCTTSSAARPGRARSLAARATGIDVAVPADTGGDERPLSRQRSAGRADRRFPLIRAPAARRAAWAMCLSLADQYRGAPSALTAATRPRSGAQARPRAPNSVRWYRRRLIPASPTRPRRHGDAAEGNESSRVPFSRRTRRRCRCRRSGRRGTAVVHAGRPIHGAGVGAGLAPSRCQLPGRTGGRGR